MTASGEGGPLARPVAPAARFASAKGRLDRSIDRWAVATVIAPLGSFAVAVMTTAFGIVPDLVAENSWRSPRAFVFYVSSALGVMLSGLAYGLLRRREAFKKRLGTAYFVDLPSSDWTSTESQDFPAQVRPRFARTFEIAGPEDWDGRWNWGLSDRLDEWDDAVEDVVKCLWVARRNDDPGTANGLFLWCWWSVAVAIGARAMRDRRGLVLEVRPRPSFDRGGQSREPSDWREKKHEFRDVPGLSAYAIETQVAQCLLQVEGPAHGGARRESPHPVVVVLRFTRGYWGPLAPDAASPEGVVVNIRQAAAPNLTSGPATLIVCNSGHGGDIPWEDYPSLAKAAVQQLQQVRRQHPGATILIGATMPQELSFGIGVFAARADRDWPEELWSLLWDGRNQQFVVPRLNIGRGGSVGKALPSDAASGAV